MPVDLVALVRTQLAQRTAIDVEDAPISANGATQRWWMVALMVGATVIALGEGSLNVLLSPHLHAKGLAETSIGLVVAGLSVAALATRFFAGAAYRPWRTRYLLPFGSLLSAIAFLALAVSSHPLALAGFTALNGIGFSLASTSGLAAIMDARPHGDAGSIMGWYTGANGLGFALAGFLGGALGDMFGTTQAIALLASIPFAAAVLLARALRQFGRTAPRAPDLREKSPARAPHQRRRFLPSGFADAGPVVWLAFAVALHINLIGGMLTTYFPLFGLAIGLSLTQIGALSGIHSSASSGVRFVAALVFRRVDYRRLTTWLVVLGGLGVAALTLSPAFVVLALAWFTIGLSRGLLRASSAALVMESTAGADSGRGAASAIYLAGLDLGKVVGPLAGGVAVGLWNYQVAFLLGGLGFPLVYLALAARIRRKQPS